MSFGKMNKLVDIVEPLVVKDDEGISHIEDILIASVRAYREGRHGSEVWANRSTFSEATDLFRFRKLPGIKVTTQMALLLDGSRFEITSVEDVKGRGLYEEVLAKEVRTSG